jgi:rhomboid protease GluP
MNNSIGDASFSMYLSKIYLANKGYKLGSVPEASAFSTASNIVLTRIDGLTCTIICVIDRETNPDDCFSMTAEAIKDIGRACLKYSGAVHRKKLPVDIRVIEISSDPPASNDIFRLKRLKLSGFSDVKLSSWALTTSSASVWTNFPLGGFFVGRSELRKLMRAPRKSDAEIKAAGVVTMRSTAVLPILTYAMLAVMAGIFVVEQIFSVGPSAGNSEPNVRTLVALGGLNPTLVFKFGEWYRILSATLLHGGAFHLLMNGLALFFVGTILESLIGRAWLAFLFVVGAIAGSSMSLALSPANIVSVGASGAIMCLLAAAYVCSFRMPMGVSRTQSQMGLLRVLIPSLVPLTSAITGQHVDFGAHLGGAMMGALAGFGLLRAWPRTSPLPRFRRLAATLAIIGLGGFVCSGVLVARRYPAYAATVVAPHPTKSSPSSNQVPNR